MKRTSVFVWALGIVLAAAVPAAVSDDSPPLVVDDDMLDCPNADFTTIQAAVDAAVPGATIHVCAGEYHERVTIMKNNLRLRAKGAPGGAVVDADLMPGSLAAFLVQDASGVRIEGFTVRGGRESDILLIRATRARIRNNRTTAAGHDGIELMNSRDNVIERNVSFNNLAPNACGINVAGAGSTGNVVRNNRTFNNEWGIQIVGSVDNVILHNEAIGNRGNGIRNIGNASGTLIEGNRAFSNGFAPSALTGTTNAGIRIGSGAGIVVSRNHAFGNTKVDLRSDVTTATFENNRCNTSAPPGLCAHDGDGDDDDDDR
jgi:parallel beta-helix repeat protein